MSDAIGRGSSSAGAVQRPTKTEEFFMPKAHIRDGELRIALSDKMRRKLAVREGEELKAHVFEGSITFTRTTEDARREAGTRIMDLIDRIRVRPGQPELSPAEIQQMVDEEVKAVRRRRGKPPPHD
jgi:hypothetical protein